MNYTLCLIVLSLMSLHCTTASNEFNLQKNTVESDRDDDITAISDTRFDETSDDSADGNDLDLDEQQSKLYLLLKRRFQPSSSRLLTGKRGGNSAADSYEEDQFWLRPSAKRAFKLLRVGRSIGSMAHRLPRMGKK